jgi:hypothetical protein
VEQRSARDLLEVLRGHRQPLGDGHGEAHHALGVVGGLALARIQGRDQRGERALVGFGDAGDGAREHARVRAIALVFQVCKVSGVKSQAYQFLTVKHLEHVLHGSPSEADSLAASPEIRIDALIA